MNHSTIKRVNAHFDDRGVFVYQAFEPRIVHAAVEKGTFGLGFGMNRMTWIKPSLGWMLQRCGYATKHNQEAVVRVHLSHEGFLHLLHEAVLTHYDSAVYPSEDVWRKALNASDVRVQFDPDRDLTGLVLPRRAIQIGLQGECVQKYVHEWILGVEDVTDLARAIHQAAQNKTELPQVPNETEYPLPADIFARLGCTP